MTTFIDTRAVALGITTPLSTDQRIALDRNAQIEKLQLAIVASNTTSAALLAQNNESNTLIAGEMDLTRLALATIPIPSKDT